MTPEQSAAYINAQAAMLNAEIAGMVAENAFRISLGLTPAYGEEGFEAIRLRCEPVLGHNAVISYFQQVNG